MRKYLISLRKSKGLTQQQAAARLLISQNYLSSIESGKRQTDLKLSTIKDFAKLYDVSVDHLIAEETKYKQAKQETEMEKGDLNALKYLQKRLDEKQIDVLAYCLTHEVPVAFYGSGLGKSTLANRLRAAGYQGVYAPEDCSMACNHLTVPDIGGAVALCVRKKSPGKDIPEDSFSDEDLWTVIGGA